MSPYNPHKSGAAGRSLLQLDHLPPFIGLSGHHEFSRPGEFRQPVPFLEERVLSRGVRGAVVATSLRTRRRAYE